MRTRKNKKCLKKRRNKTKKYGGVATLSGRVPKKTTTFAEEQGKQREIEKANTQIKRKAKTKASKITKHNPTITKTKKVGPWGAIKYKHLMPIIEQHNKKAHSDGPYMGPMKIKTKLDQALTTGLAKEHTNAFAERPIRNTYFPEFMNKYVPENVRKIYSQINIRINSNIPLSDKGKARVINDLKELKLDENSDNLAVLKDSPVYKLNKQKLKLLIEEAYKDKDNTFLQDF